MDKFNLTSGKSGLGYNASIDASIANNFATAAFRFAHTLIPGIMKLLNNDTSSPEYVQLHEMLLDPFKLYDDGELDRALRGAMNTPIENSDPFFTNEVSIQKRLLHLRGTLRTRIYIRILFTYYILLNPMRLPILNSINVA